MNKTFRKSNIIYDDLTSSKESFSYNVRLIICCTVVIIILGVLYNMFVLNNGTKFDHTLSILVLLFFGVVILFNIFDGRKNYYKLKSYKREYKIATETPEERQVRERSEKFTRILKKPAEEK